MGRLRLGRNAAEPIPRRGEPPEYNSVDAALWYVVVVGELLQRTTLPAADRRRLLDAVRDTERLRARQRELHHADPDGLLRWASRARSSPGWMRRSAMVVTLRIGKPVEVQALWTNALAVGERIDRHWRRAAERATASFLKRFPIGEDASTMSSTWIMYRAATIRLPPNQLFAAGGLPVTLLKGAAARALADLVEDRLWILLGPRSLHPEHPDYVAAIEAASWSVTAHTTSARAALAVGRFRRAWPKARGNIGAARVQARATLYRSARRLPRRHRPGLAPRDR